MEEESWFNEVNTTWVVLRFIGVTTIAVGSFGYVAFYLMNL